MNLLFDLIYLICFKNTCICVYVYVCLLGWNTIHSNINTNDFPEIHHLWMTTLRIFLDTPELVALYFSKLGYISFFSKSVGSGI